MKPIIFSTEMVKAILSGRKTQTRRVIRPQPVSLDSLYPNDSSHVEFWEIVDSPSLWCPYGRPGDILWVRESFCIGLPNTWQTLNKKLNPDDPDEAAYFKAGWDRSHPYWRPSIHMPRWASRIKLKILRIILEKLQDISREDCYKEGIENQILTPAHSPIEKKIYSEIWDSINKKRGFGWDKNSWVWVITFQLWEEK